MAKRVVSTIVTYSIILLIATIAALFSVGAADTVWDILVKVLDVLLDTLSPPSILERVGVMIVLMSIILLPVVFILGAAFVVTYFSLTLLRRCCIFEQNNTATRLAVIVLRLIVSFAYAALSLFILLGCVFTWRLYEYAAIRSPAPYPGAVVAEETLPNLGGFEGLPENNTTTIVYEYSVELPLNEVEDYYTIEMEKHCIAGWEFTDTACTSDAKCRKAECEISHPLVRLVKDAKHFVLVLHSVSETETNVSYVERKHDLMGGWFPDIFAAGNGSSVSCSREIRDPLSGLTQVGG